MREIHPPKSESDAPDDAVLLRDVTFAYPGGVDVIKVPILSIPQGGLVSILGPSGCGKTTLMLLIAGLIQPTVGQVSVLGRSTDSARRDGLLSFMFQQPSLIPWRRAVDNVALPFALSGQTTDPNRVLDALRMVGLEDAGSKYPDQLSGGMRSRIALAQAVITRPDLLLLDEPLGDLDEATRVRLALAIAELQQSLNMTVVMVTHNIHDAVLISDTILLLGLHATDGPATIDDTIKIMFENRNLTSVKSQDFQDLYAHIVDMFNHDNGNINYV